VEPVFVPCATVLFTDFTDFTRIAGEMNPKELVKELDYFFTEFDRIIDRHGLEKLKTIGDAYMCAGGVTDRSKDHALRAVRAASDIRDFMNRDRAERESGGRRPWNARIGIHSGPLMAGVIGRRKFAYDVWGDAVNVASRLESSGAAGEINISLNVYEMIRREFDCEQRGMIEAKNKGKIEMFFVRGAKGA
jgi:class 3 adenylate cyclase